MASKDNQKCIYFVDDEPRICKVVAETLKAFCVKVVTFTDPSRCLEKLACGDCDLLITDLKMPDMNGIELLIKAKKLAPWLPVIVVTGYGDIPSAVKAVKAGAADFIEKPLDKEELHHKIETLLNKEFKKNKYLGKPLTPTELKVLTMITQSQSSKEMATLLHRSVRTVEVHRSRIMSKLGVDNLVSLIKRAALMGLVELPEKTDRDDLQES